jgi:hypothetical protein
MSNLIVMPDGNALTPALIKVVQFIKGKGVICKDAQQRMVSWVPVKDDIKGQKVRDLMIRIAGEGSRSPQPDWSFLEEQVVEVSTE